MSPDLKELLDEHMSRAPAWRRWLARAALAIAAPQGQPGVMASPVLGLLVAVVVVVVIVYVIYEVGCWLGAWQPLC